MGWKPSIVRNFFLCLLNLYFENCMSTLSLENWSLLSKRMKKKIEKVFCCILFPVHIQKGLHKSSGFYMLYFAFSPLSLK